MPEVSILGEPADLVGRRTRCAILVEQSRPNELRQEAELLAADLRAGKWQLDRVTWNHVNDVLDTWLKRPPNAAGDDALASALEWLYERRTTNPSLRSGIHVLTAADAPVTMLWSFGVAEDRAFIAGPRYLESKWLADLDLTEASISGTIAIRIARSSALSTSRACHAVARRREPVTGRAPTGDVE